jgi:hypothetical protein
MISFPDPSLRILRNRCKHAIIKRQKATGKCICIFCGEQNIQEEEYGSRVPR